MRRGPVAAAFLLIFEWTCLTAVGYGRLAAADSARYIGSQPSARSRTQPIDSETVADYNEPVFLAQSVVPPYKLHRVVLAWSPSETSLTNDDTVGYYVYRCAGESGKFVRLNKDPVLDASYIDEYVRSGGVYYYTTTTVTRSGRQSRHSNIVRVVIP